MECVSWYILTSIWGLSYSNRYFVRCKPCLSLLWTKWLPLCKHLFTFLLLIHFCTATMMQIQKTHIYKVTFCYEIQASVCCPTKSVRTLCHSRSSNQKCVKYEIHCPSPLHLILTYKTSLCDSMRHIGLSISSSGQLLGLNWPQCSDLQPAACTASEPAVGGWSVLVCQQNGWLLDSVLKYSVIARASDMEIIIKEIMVGTMKTDIIVKGFLW